MSVRMPPQHIGCLRRFRPAVQARVQVLCFPHAGGGALGYRALAAEMPEHVDVLAVQYGAREDRYREAASTSVHDRVAEVMEGVCKLPSLPRVLFGHSMGALLAFETARAMERQWPGQPRLLIASGSDASARAGSSNARPVPGDEEILAGLRSLGATPRAVLLDPALARVLLPALRADYGLLAGYTGDGVTPVACPLVACAGTDDPEVSRAGVAAWASLTRGAFRERWIEGDHFGLVRQPRALCDLLLSELDRLAACVPDSPPGTLI